MAVSPGAVAPLDTARGVIAVVGNEPVSAVMLTLTSAEATLVLVGEPSVNQLRKLAATEVTISGRRTSEVDRTASPRGSLVFRVQRFLVRAVDGTPAEDGELRSTAAGFVLRRVDGSELKLSALPPALESRVGARIFLAGALDRAPVAYGVIAR